MSQKKFKDFLLTLTKNELTKIRKHWQFGGISQLNKAELAAALDKRIKKI